VLPSQVRIVRPASPQSLPNCTGRRRRWKTCLAPPLLVESLERELVSPFSEKPPEHEQALAQPEAPLEDGLVSPQQVESLVRVLVPPPPEEPPESVPVVKLRGDCRRVLVEEEPSEGEVLSPL